LVKLEGEAGILFFKIIYRGLVFDLSEWCILEELADRRRLLLGVILVGFLVFLEVRF
jgi:hypothetical protein